jgi:hypothetical protein
MVRKTLKLLPEDFRVFLCQIDRKKLNEVKSAKSEEFENGTSESKYNLLFNICMYIFYIIIMELVTYRLDTASRG